MRQKAFISLLILTGCLAGDFGEACADFRHARIGARPKALGSAFVSLVDDANASYWNPAGLTRTARNSLMVTRGWLYGISDIYNDYLCADLPSFKGVHFGVSWVRLGVDDLYSENTLNFGAAFRTPFLPGLSLGAAGKLFMLDAPGYRQYNDPAYQGSDRDYSFDLGIHYDSGGAWTLGGVLYNLTAPTLQLLSTTADPDPVYREWAVGGSYLFRETLLVTVDARNREGRWSDAILLGGAEIWFFNSLALRAGVDGGLVTMGIALQDVHWQTDFTLETNRDLGNIYMLSFTVRD